MNMKLFGIVVLILVIGGGIFFMQNTQEPKSKTATEAKTEEQTATKAAVINDEKKTFTLDEVAKHNSETDCWMVIQGKVYNATDFVSNHPGGQAILNGCGIDASTLFTERPTNNKGPHPESANKMLEKLYIGDLK